MNNIKTINKLKEKLEVRDLSYDSTTDPLGSLLIVENETIDMSGVEALEARMRHEAIVSLGKRAIKLFTRL